MEEMSGRREHYLHAKSTAELLQPEVLPEAGFQSYEELKNNGLQLTRSFITGNENNPNLHHPHLEQTNHLEEGIDNINHAIKTISQIERDTQKADIISTSLKFRSAEMEYVKKLALLDEYVEEDMSESSISDLLEETRDLGRELYGDVDPEILSGVQSTIWNTIDSTELHPSAQPLYDQLSNGFTWNDEYIPGLDRPSTLSTLPSFNDPSLKWTGDTIIEAHPDEAAVVSRFWERKTSQYGDDYTASPEDIAEAFIEVIGSFDNESNPTLSVVTDPNSNSLSWETSMMAVKVGLNRQPITSKDQLMQKVAHELLIHGGRAMNGLKTELPVLGTGLYTDTARPDYLTFEEGLATTLEESIGNRIPKWSPAMLTPYVNISLVNQGADFRSAYETSWRWRLLMNLDDNQEVTPQDILNEKIKTYTAALRVFRGTPTTMQDKYPGAKVLTYNKDLSYLNGRVIAMNHLKELHNNNDTTNLLKLMDAKYDPTIPEQAEIVRQYSVA